MNHDVFIYAPCSGDAGLHFDNLDAVLEPGGLHTQEV